MPAGVVRVADKMSVTQYNVVKAYNGVFDNRDTDAQVKEYARTNLGLPSVDYVLSVSARTNLWTVINEVYTYQRYPPGDAIRSASNYRSFSETGPIQYDNVPTTAASPIPPPVASRNGANLVRITDVYRENGAVVSSCALQTFSDRYYFANANDFKQLMSEEFPNLSVTWHSIVHKTTAACNAGETNYSQGLQYMDLTQRTGGLAANICDNDYEQFVSDLAYAVVNEVDVFYKLPAAMLGKEIVSVVNETSAKELSAGTDYRIINGDTIGIDKQFLQKDDRWVVTFKK
jgi:hypothetical protein